MASAKLYYFNGRGRGELIRFVLAACGTEFTEVMITEKEQIEKLRADGFLQFQQVPVLEIDGMRLSQTNAIVRHLARTRGLFGVAHKDTARIDELFEGSRDFMTNFYAIGFIDEKEALKKIETQSLPRYLPIFDKVLKENGSGFLVGSSMTLADIGLFEPMTLAVDYFTIDVLKDYPHMKNFYEKMSSEERISKFLSGPQRKKVNSPAYVATVTRVLYS